MTPHVGVIFKSKSINVFLAIDSNTRVMAGFRSNSEIVGNFNRLIFGASMKYENLHLDQLPLETSFFTQSVFLIISLYRYDWDVLIYLI